MFRKVFRFGAKKVRVEVFNLNDGGKVRGNIEVVVVEKVLGRGGVVEKIEQHFGDLGRLGEFVGKNFI